jgi:hypothetical protein
MGTAGPVTSCAFAVPATAAGRLLTGVVGVTTDGVTLNRSFTLRVADPNRRHLASGRAGGKLAPIPGASLRAFGLSAQRPTVGKRVVATASFANLGSGTGSIACSGAAGGKRSKVLGSSFKAPGASCALLVPTGVSGKILVFSVTVTTRGARVTHSFHLPVRS